MIGFYHENESGLIKSEMENELTFNLSASQIRIKNEKNSNCISWWGRYNFWLKLCCLKSFYIFENKRLGKVDLMLEIPKKTVF